ncbi:MAG: HAMP domain-containing histidine kinase, partial [Sphingobacteriaceae bacterium]|nr:HAMP domain-containing histidine kinase [Cytophagaceae bacterium]
LFERFTKLGREGTAGERSTGMGLYLSRKIVERHQGTLQACSEGVNRGATFTIMLPDSVS